MVRRVIYRQIKLNKKIKIIKSIGCLAFSIKNVFYDKMDLTLSYFHVTIQ